MRRPPRVAVHDDPASVERIVAVPDPVEMLRGHLAAGGLAIEQATCGSSATPGCSAGRPRSPPTSTACAVGR